VSVYASDSGDPVTKADLEEFGSRLEQDMMTKLWRWAVATMGGSLLLAMAGSWAAAIWRLQVDQRLDIVERHVGDIDANGTHGLQNLSRQIDSLKIEMRYLPTRIVSELQARNR
jgi:hypothetical protein